MLAPRPALELTDTCFMEKNIGHYTMGKQRVEGRGGGGVNWKAKAVKGSTLSPRNQQADLELVVQSFRLAISYVGKEGQ